ncbi:MAG TPA: hypothetical protein VF595_05965 [Tepidisphaeraceae bacterium]|jgi:hypothetical protein
MPDVLIPSFSNGASKNPQPTVADKARIVLALWEKSKAPSFDAQAVVDPIMKALGRTTVMKPGQLNGYKKTVRKAVQANDREVIEILKAGGFPVTGDDQPKEALPVPLDRATGDSLDQESDQS